MSNKVKVKEKRLTPSEFEEALVQFAKSPPDIVDEAEFRLRLRGTTISRYKRGSDLLDEVQNALNKAAKGEAGKRELSLAIKSVDDAIVQMTHGALAFNKAAPYEGIRNLLMVTRTAAKPRSRK